MGRCFWVGIDPSHLGRGRLACVVVFCFLCFEEGVALFRDAFSDAAVHSKKCGSSFNLDLNVTEHSRSIGMTGSTQTD